MFCDNICAIDKHFFGRASACQDSWLMTGYCKYYRTVRRTVVQKANPFLKKILRKRDWNDFCARKPSYLDYCKAYSRSYLVRDESQDDGIKTLEPRTANSKPTKDYLLARL